jgi:hypothetical protein
MMDRPSHTATAYWVLLEYPLDSDGKFRPSKGTAALDRVRVGVSAIRDRLVRHA